MSGDHNMYQKSKSYLDDFEYPRCGHCCQALEAEPEALRLADALDDEFAQGRISNHNGRKAAVELRRLHAVNQTYHEKVIPKREWVGLTDEEIDALSQARSLTDELMDCVDRLGSEADTVDPRVWQHLLVYAPKPEQEPVAWMHTTGTGHVYFRKKPQDKVFNPQPVYTASPKRTWVGLTGKDIDDCYFAARTPDFDLWAFAAEIDDLLREKNKW